MKRTQRTESAAQDIIHEFRAREQYGSVGYDNLRIFKECVRHHVGAGCGLNAMKELGLDHCLPPGRQEDLPDHVRIYKNLKKHKRFTAREWDELHRQVLELVQDWADALAKDTSPGKRKFYAEKIKKSPRHLTALALLLLRDGVPSPTKEGQ